MAVRAYQETAGLPVTGVLDDATLASLRRPEAPRMPVSEARATATATDVARAGSGTVKATTAAEVATAVGTAAATGNALTEATTALAEAGKVVTTVDAGRSLGTRAWDLVTWVATPRGAVVALSVALCIGTWALVRYIRARRVQAHREGRQV
jgi:peptidoglycan hydrolase-like protein with peptidoglycan-binding domain